MSIKKFKDDLNIEKINIIEENQDYPIRIRPKKNSFEARMTLLIDGVNERLSFTAISITKAYNKAKDVRSSYGYGEIIAKNNNILMEDICLEWLNFKYKETEVVTKKDKKALSKKTFVGYRTYVLVHIIPKLGNIKVKNLNNKILQKFIDNIKLKGKTVTEIYLVLKMILDYCVKNRVIPKNLAIGLELPVIVKAQIDFLEQEDYKKFVSACEFKGKIGESLLTILYSGIRAEELCGLDFTKVDFDNNILKIRNAYQDNYIYNEKMEIIGHERGITPLKTPCAVRDIPMTKKLRELLYNIKLRHMKQKGEDFLETDFIFTNKFGRPLITDNMGKRLQRLIKEFNLNHITVHGLRHTFATYCIEAGMKPTVLQVILGHADYKTTIAFYVHITHKNKDESMQVVGTYIEDFNNIDTKKAKNNLVIEEIDLEALIIEKANQMLQQMLQNVKV